MFPQSQRLGKSVEVMRTLQKGRRSSIGPIRCTYVPAVGRLRVTVIISKKTAKLAVDRNFTKRRVRSALRSLQLPQGDLVVSVFNGAPTLSYKQISLSLSLCLAKLF